MAFEERQNQVADERVPSQEPVDKVIEENVIEPSDSEPVKKVWYAVPRPRAATVITASVGALWTGVALKTGFQGPPVLDSLLLLVVGGFFADSQLDKKRTRDKKKEDSGE